MTTTAILENIRNGLIQNALIRYLSLSPVTEHNKIVSASFANSGILSGVCILLNLLLAHYLSISWHAPLLEKMFYLYSLVYLISGILTQFQFIEQAYLKFNSIFFTTFIRQGSFFRVCFYLLCFSYQYKSYKPGVCTNTKCYSKYDYFMDFCKKILSL